MATIKVVLRKKQNKDGTFPLAIRITQDRKTSFVHLGKHILDSQWDAENQRVKKNHPNATRFNNFLLTKLVEANNKSLELETQKPEISSRAVKQKIKPGGGVTFFVQADIYLKNLYETGKYNRYTADKPRINHFKDFLRGEDITFPDVSIALLERFKVYLKSKLSISDRTIANHLVVIRSVFSQAIKEGITDAKYYPFGSGRIQIKFPQSMKIGLTQEDVKKLEELDLSASPTLNHARNLWLFSFYLAGIRVSDIFRLRWSDIHQDRLFYMMGKNAKGGSLKIPDKALAILKFYESERKKHDDLIFPELKRLPSLEDKFIVQRTIAFATSRTDKFLRLQIAPLIGIDKKLTMHIARHTFGNLSGDKIPIQMLQKLYRHSSVTTTIGYQANFIHRDADDALDAVIGF